MARDFRKSCSEADNWQKYFRNFWPAMASIISATDGWINMAWQNGMHKSFAFYSLLFSFPALNAVKLNVFSKNASIYAYTFFLTFVFLLSFQSIQCNNAKWFLSLEEKWEFFFFVFELWIFFNSKHEFYVCALKYLITFRW